MHRAFRFTSIVALVAGFALVAPVLSAPSADADRPSTDARERRVRLEVGRTDARGPVDRKERHDGHDSEAEPVDHVEIQESDMVRASAPIDAGDAVLLGARWRDDAGVEMRTQTNGEWSEWIRLRRDVEEHLPDDDSDEFAGVDLGVSEPVWTGHVDHVQFRSTGTEDLTALFIDSVGGDGLAWAVGGASAGAAHAAPRILRRADWGADESLRDGRIDYSSSGTVRFSVVHHEGGSPGWTASEIRNGCQKADDKINAIYEYHTKHRGYWDIAYNFVVDPCGQIWEGRAGGMEQPVNGAHAGGFNDGSVGVLALGTFGETTSDPITARMVAGIEEIIGYKLDLDLVEAGSSTREVSGGGSARWPSGTRVTLPVLSAHQISNSTACPGGKLMDRLFVGRNYSATPRATYVNGVRKHTPSVSTLTGPHTVVALGDWTSDGNPEALFYDPSTGHTTVFGVRADGTLGAELNRYRLAPGWSHIVAGDWDGDGDDELTLLRNGDGTFVTYSGAENGWIGSRLTLRSLNFSWDHVVAGDWNGNGRDQLSLHRNHDGRYSSYTMTTRGDLNTLTTHRHLNVRWNSLVAGDWSGSGRDQLTFQRNSDGRFSSYTMTRRGDLKTMTAHARLNVVWRRLVSTDLGGSQSDEYLLYTSRNHRGRLSTYRATNSGRLGSNLSIQFLPS